LTAEDDPPAAAAPARPPGAAAASVGDTIAEPTLLVGSAACSLLRRTLRHRTNLEDRMELEPGATNTLTVVVDESMTADRFGNTGVQVLATRCW
jgi:hypothetical protein